MKTALCTCGWPIDPSTTGREHAPDCAKIKPIRDRYTCPNCERKNVLTEYEARKHYQCRDCTRAEEFGL